MHQKSWSYAILFLEYMVCDRCNYFSFWAILCPFTALKAHKTKNSKKTKQTNKQTKTMYQKLWLDNVQFLGYGVQWKDGWKKWCIEVGAPPKKINILNRVQLSLGWTKKNYKQSSLIQALIYRSNIYYSKIYKREDWKSSSSTLHLEVWTSYFRHRYWIISE